MATNMEGLVQHRVGTQQVAEVSDRLAQWLAPLLLKGKLHHCALLFQNSPSEVSL